MHQWHLTAQMLPNCVKVTNADAKYGPLFIKLILSADMGKCLYFVFLIFAISCSSTSEKLIDNYYVYSPDEYCDSYYLKCKLSNDRDPVIDKVHSVYWNDSTIIVEQRGEKHNWWIIRASDEKLKCCNNDIVIGPVSERSIKAYMKNAEFSRLVFN